MGLLDVLAPLWAPAGAVWSAGKGAEEGAKAVDNWSGAKQAREDETAKLKVTEIAGIAELERRRKEQEDLKKKLKQEADAMEAAGASMALRRRAAMTARPRRMTLLAPLGAGTGAPMAARKTLLGS